MVVSPSSHESRFLPVGLTRDAINQHTQPAVRQSLYCVARLPISVGLGWWVRGWEDPTTWTVDRLEKDA